MDIQTHLPGHLLIESSIDAMIAIDNEETITEWNNAATILYDRPRTKAMGRLLQDAVPSVKDDAAFRNAIQWAREGKKSFLPASPDFAHRVHVEIHVIPLLRAAMVVGTMLLIHDVAHRISKELELQSLNEELENRLRQLRLTHTELSQLTNIASHNIRGPIRIIYTAVEGLLVSEAGVMSHSGRATFRRIQSSLNRMSLLLDDMAMLTQINLVDRPGGMVNIGELVQEIKNLFMKKMQDSNAVISTGELHPVLAHRNQLLLLLQQLFSNVMRSVVDGAPRMHITCTPVQPAGRKGAPARTWHLLSVTHNSPAFDNAERSFALDVTDNADFYNYTGPAIAMIIARKIIEVHEGFMEVEKTSSGETMLKCFFPVGDGEAGKR